MTNPRPGEVPWADLARWLAGEMDPAEAAAMERWVESDPQRAELVTMLRQAWLQAGAAGEGWDARAAIQRVRSTEAAGAGRIIARLGGGVPVSSKRRSPMVALAVAAAILLVPGVAFLMGRFHSPPAVAAVTVAEYRTPRGQRLSLRLPDGTRVMLAPGSVMRRSSDYGQIERRVELEGHGYFVVTHDDQRPFTVHTPRLVAKDLGTRFTVRAYPTDSVDDVIVAEGKVAIGTVVLEAGDRGRVGGDGALRRTRRLPLGRFLAWTDGKLVFQDTPLDEVAAQIERWYDVEVRLRGARLAGLRVTGAFGDEPVTEVLSVVARSLGLEVRRDGNHYLLH